MPARLVRFPSTVRARTRGGDALPEREQHVIRQRLDELGKDIKWLAEKMRVKPRCLYNHMAGKSELNGRNFALMLQYLEIDLNYYCRVGKYARSNNGGQPLSQQRNTNTNPLSH